MTTPAPSAPAPLLLSLPEAAATTGVPIAAIRRHAELEDLIGEPAHARA